MDVYIDIILLIYIYIYIYIELIKLKKKTTQLLRSEKDINKHFIKGDTEITRTEKMVNIISH